MRPIMGIDIETFSTVPLPKCGVYRYVDSADFEVLLFSYAVDDGPVQLIDLACGERLPSDVLALLEDESIVKMAYNAQFERVCLSKHIGHWLDPSQWRCTAVMASYLTLPARLADVAVALKLAQQKKEEGKDLIRFFSIPCKPTKTNGGRTRNLPEHAPEKWQQYRAYNMQDVETERAVRKALETHPLPEQEWPLYALDQRINDRGVRVDRLLVKQAMRCDEVFSRQAFQRAQAITGLDNPGSVPQLKVWLADQDMQMESLAKKIVQEKATSTDGVVSELLNLRLELSKTSVKKYEAMARTLCKDGRVHGLLQFGGASRTFRWSSRLIQIQNLPANHLPDLALARDLVKAGEVKLLDMLFGSVPNTLSELIRTAFIPKGNHRFIVADFSAIEARVLAWLAGEEWVLEEFRDRGKIYEATAARMFHVPVETIVRDHDNYAYRQKGKQAVLSCIAEGQLVLTNKGLVPIELITTAHMLWDGEGWVAHDGIVFTGRRKVLRYEGLTATPDHLVWIEGKPEPVWLAYAAASGAHLTVTGDGGKAIRLGENHQSRKTVVEKLEPLLCADTVCFMPQHPVDQFIESDARKIQGMPELLRTAQTNPHVAGPPVNRGKETLRKSEGPQLPPLWRERDPIQLSVCNQSRHLDPSKCTECTTGLRNGQDRQRRALRSWKYTICAATHQLWQSAINGAIRMGSGVLAVLSKRRHTDAVGGQNPAGDFGKRPARGHRKKEELAHNPDAPRLYDIRNAGPRHRFTVSGKLVHNCGYGGGVGALVKMGAKMPREEMQPLVAAWRGANRNIVKLWNALEDAAFEVVENQTSARVGKVRLFWQDDKMFIQLPSGRRLCYLSPGFITNRFGGKSIGYLSASKAGKLVQEDTWGGKLTENVTQAIARDLLAFAMLNLEAAGYRIIFHVHDEVVLEMPIGQGTLEEACEIMGRAPDWAEGLPLRADGYECDGFYRKD